MQLHTLVRKTKNKKKRVVGRGGKHAKTSGRGTKGQKSRAGHSIRPALRDAIKKIPKKRGHGKNRARTVNPARIRPAIVNLAALEAAFAAGASVTPRTLLSARLISRKQGRLPEVKILAQGELSKKLAVSGCLVSEAARQGIERAGGTVESA